MHALSEELHGRHDPAGAIVSIDPATGAIRAMAAVTPGTPGNQFNLATTAERQAGLDVQADRPRRGGRATG